MEVAGDFRNAENQKHDAGNTVAVDVGDEDRTCETFFKKDCEIETSFYF